jgi:MFS family permease
MSAIAYAPLGWLNKTITPMRVVLIALFALASGSILAYFLVDDQRSFLIYSLIFALPTVGFGLGSLTINMQLFPSEEFGAFQSGLNVFSCGGFILGNLLLGRFMDVVNSNYRMVFIWNAVIYAVAIIPMWGVYKAWKKHGGPDHYVPPKAESVRRMGPDLLAQKDLACMPVPTTKII